MKGAKAGAKALRNAAKLMNDGGRHWTKGMFRRVWYEGDEITEDSKQVSFCYAGGLHEVIFARVMENDLRRFRRQAYVAAIRASALAIGGGLYTSALRRYEKAQADEKYAARLTKDTLTGRDLETWFTVACEGVIFSFNDRQRTTWKQVEAKLLEAADGLEAAENAT
jgi:hypothetical protein